MPDMTEGTVGSCTDPLMSCQLDPARTCHSLTRGNGRPGTRVPRPGRYPGKVARVPDHFPELVPERSDFQPSFAQEANSALEMGGS